MSEPTRLGALSDEVIRLTRASNAIRSHLSSHGHSGIEMAAYRLLFELEGNGPKRSSALAESACVDPSTISRQVGQLVKAGLVERRSDPEDGRATLLGATARGHEVCAARRKDRIEMFSRLVDGWSEQDVETLTELLSRLNDSITAARPTLVAAIGTEPRINEETA